MCLHHRGLSCTWTLLENSYRKAAPGHVYITNACAAPGHVALQGPELHLDLSTLQRPVLHLDVSTPGQGPELHLNLAGQQEPVLPVDMSTLQGRELHLDDLDVFTVQRSVLLLEDSTAQGPELYLDVSTLQRPALYLNMSTPQGPELHLDLSTPQEPELHMDFSEKQEHMLLLNVSTPYRGETCTWTCLHYKGLCYSGRCLTAEACTAPGQWTRLHTGAWAAHGRVYSKGTPTAQWYVSLRFASRTNSGRLLCFCILATNMFASLR
jgi:hypothetical protein